MPDEYVAKLMEIAREIYPDRGCVWDLQGGKKYLKVGGQIIFCCHDSLSEDEFREALERYKSNAKSVPC